LPAAVFREETITSEPVERGADAIRKRSLQHACQCARTAEDYRGQDTIVLDLTKITALFDYFVLTTGNSPRQMRAIADEVDRQLKHEGSRRLGLEGYEASTWILQDYGDVVLHVFTPETRRVYDLERLWADAPRVDWRAQAEADSAESSTRRVAR